MPDWYTDPPIAVAILSVLIGFGILLKGADVLVQGAVVSAKRFGLTTAVIGATVVAFGTSLPELMVSVFSNIMASREGLAGSPDGPAAIAVANVIGSNIFNIGMVLAVAALICRMPVPRTSMRIDLPLMLGSYVLLFLFCMPIGDGVALISRLEGGILFVALLLYTYLAVKLGKVDEGDIPDDNQSTVLSATVKIVIGIILLAVGGELTLNGGVSVAREIGMTDRVIGLTVMAIGTSLPELATSVQAARKGETDIAVANILGSNCFNILSILGVSALIAPLPVNLGILYWDFWWMLGISVVVLPAMFWRRIITWPTGLALLLALSTYMLLLIVMPGLGVPEATSSPTELVSPVESSVETATESVNVDGTDVLKVDP